MKNIKNIIWPVALLIATSAVGFAENHTTVVGNIPTQATTKGVITVGPIGPIIKGGPVQNLERDISHDEFEIQREKNQDKQKLGFDKHHDPGAVASDKADLHSDYKELRLEKQDLRQDEQELNGLLK